MLYTLYSFSSYFLGELLAIALFADPAVVRQVSPDAAITGDVIVGFPGETEEQFQHTLDLMERVKFDSLNTFRSVLRLCLVTVGRSLAPSNIVMLMACFGRLVYTVCYRSHEHIFGSDLCARLCWSRRGGGARCENTHSCTSICLFIHIRCTYGQTAVIVVLSRDETQADSPISPRESTY